MALMRVKQEDGTIVEIPLGFAKSTGTGEDGRGIVSIEKTGFGFSESGNVRDIYTITYTDGTTSEFTVTNGKDGTPGKNGDDGVGISKAEIDENGEFILTFTNGTATNLGCVVGTSGTSTIPTTVSTTGATVQFEGAVENVEVKGNATVDAATTIKLIHSGKNLLNMTSSNLTGTDAQYEDGWIVVERTEPNSNEYSNAKIPMSDAAILPNKKYYVYVEFHSEHNIDGFSSLMISQAASGEPWSGVTTRIEGAGRENKIYRYTLSTKENFDSTVSNGLRCIIYWTANSAYGKWKFRIWYELAPDDAVVSEEKTISNVKFVEAQPIAVYTKSLSAGHTGEYSWEDITPIDGVNVLQVSDGEITVSYKKNEAIQIKDNLSGKKIVYDGDSICYGADGIPYATQISELTNSTYVNQARSSAFVTSTTERHSVVDNLVNLPTDGDLYCFEGGVNDFWNNIPIGTLSSIYTGELDKTTLIGALETIFRYAIENFPGKPICYVITHNTMSEKNANGNTLKEFRDAIISACEKYCIPYFDGYTKCGLNVWNAAQKAAYCLDGVHPNTEGYKKYYVPQVLAMFKEVMPNE